MSIFGDLLGSIISSGANKKAAKIQAATTDKILAANEANRQYAIGLNQPAIDRGNEAAGLYGGLLGIGDGAASGAALDTWRTSAGYQDLVSEGLGAVNAGAYARGTADSGATLKALQRTGTGLANQTQQQYLGNLGNLIATGQSAIGAATGVASSTTFANNSALQTLADARGNAVLANGGIWAGFARNTDRNLSNLASSFGGFGR